MFPFMYLFDAASRALMIMPLFGWPILPQEYKKQTPERLTTCLASHIMAYSSFSCLSTKEDLGIGRALCGATIELALEPTKNVH